MSNNPRVQNALPIVVFGAVAFSVVMSVGFLLSRGSLYDQIGEGVLSGLARAHELDREPIKAPTVGEEWFAGSDSLLSSTSASDNLCDLIAPRREDSDQYGNVDRQRSEK